MAKRITIVGTGFGALTAVRTLRKRDPSVEITVVGKKAEFFYYPSLIWVPSGRRTAADLTVNLDNFFKKMKVTFHQGAAKEVKNGGRLLLTENGEVENDALLIASGGRYLRKLPGIEHAAIPCEGMEAAEKIRDRLKEMEGGTIACGFGGNPNEPSAMRGGPIFEFLFGIHTQLKNEGRRDKFKLVFFSPAAEPGKRLGEKAVGRLLKAMADREIETHLGHKMKRFSDSTVVTEGGEFAADLIVFMPGMSGSTWLMQSDLPKSAGGLLPANPFCQVEGQERIYAVGDCGSFPGPAWMPKQAHMADLQAAAAAKNILAELNGESASHTFKVELACIVDSLDSGMLVTRTPKRNLMLPSMKPLHWAKILFEKLYLRQYR
ncbi:MAG: FAD-dependent oxidoreductase [Gammaproteobacteria bacterium]|nr:FAD-dependent oxidoreductase [Gammaproteobacteria bacterium]